MSMFENEQYCWRETYFVLFESPRRPTLDAVRHQLLKLNNRFSLTNLVADDHGRVESLTVLAPDDFAALDVCFVDGDEVVEQAATMADELEPGDTPAETRRRRDRVRRCNARFDVLHFEQVVNAEEGEEEAEGMLDPTALLVVLEALARLTDGVAFDPQAGTML
jgi:hypothetical protein